MTLTDYIKKLIRDYLAIFAIIVIGVTILRHFFSPEKYFELKDIFIYMICALVGDLPSLIFYSPKELSEKEMRIRGIIHFVVLEAVMLSFTNIMGLVAGVLETGIFAVQLAVFYLIIRFLSFGEDRRSAHRINKKLREIKGKTKECPAEKQKE